MKGKKSRLGYITYVLPPVLAILCLFVVVLRHQQAGLPMLISQEFVGEYRYEGGEWQALEDATQLSALKGDVELRGHFLREMEDNVLNFCRDHIGVEFSINGELVYLDAVAEFPDLAPRQFASMCAREWVGVVFPPVGPEDLVEIRLSNPHCWGNEGAYREFLATMCIDNPRLSLLRDNLESYGNPGRIIGGLLMVAALLLLGISVAVIVAKVPGGQPMLELALMTFFYGGYIFWDTVDISLRHDLNVSNTYCRQLAMMLAVFYMGRFLCSGLHGKGEALARKIMLVSALFNSLCILSAFTGVAVIYDTLPWWTASQVIFCPALIFCCAMELHHLPRGERLVPVSGILLHTAVLLDLTGWGSGIVWRGVWSKGTFLVLFVVYMVIGTRKVIWAQTATERAKRLERELEDSRIAIMLSQIRPHFLFNVLNTIYHLCGKSPAQAQEALDSFGDYLRCNMSSLEKLQTIPFREEYKHIQAYLRLEQMRFEGELNVIYDMEATDFYLPALTIQPMVENAIKHGLSKKRGGGVVTVSTRETGDSFEVTVADTGVGFEVGTHPEKEDVHIGIRNVRSRLERMVGGTLTITSHPGRGTTAVITIPKKEENHEDHSGGR